MSMGQTPEQGLATPCSGQTRGAAPPSSKLEPPQPSPKLQHQPQPDAKLDEACLYADTNTPRGPDELEAQAPSLSRHLLLMLGMLVMLTACLQAMAVYRVSLQETEEVFDLQMQRLALSLSGGIASSVLDDRLLLESDVARDWTVQIWRADGSMLYRSSNARLLPQQAVLGFSNVEAHGRKFRVYALQTPIQVIQVAQTVSSRKEMASTLALRTILPVALALPLVLALMWWAIARSFKPLRKARQALAQRSISDLSPLEREGLPAEVQPLLREVNLLLGRLDHAWTTQQHFVADAAHELRSPLAALRLQAQSLQRAQAPEQREVAMQRLLGGLDRATRMVEQLLALARQEGAQISPVAATHFDATALCQRVLADMSPLAQARSIALSAPQLDGVMLHGHAEGFASLARNLVENAIRYTPEGGVVQLRLQAGHSAITVPQLGHVAKLKAKGVAVVGNAMGTATATAASNASLDASTHPKACADGAAEAVGAVLLVEDSGPGIAPEERARVLDRFYRVPGSAAGGSGLGLAIVQSIVQGFGATLLLEQSSDLGGLQVKVQFP